MHHFEDFKDKKDFMNGFLQAKRDHPNEVTDNEVIGYLIINVSWAFSEFTSSHPTSTFTDSQSTLTSAHRFSPAQTQQASS